MSDRTSRRGWLRAALLRGDEPEEGAAPPKPAEPSPEQRARARRRPPVLPILRPPGALDEAAFLEACTRCGDCARACPHGVLKPVQMRMPHVANTPTFDPAAGPCLLCEDVPCAAACPTEALSPERGVKMGTARVKTLDCVAATGCTVCREQCPVPWAISQEPGKPPAIDVKACVGCGVCQHVCPAPGNAIVLTPRGLEGAHAF